MSIPLPPFCPSVLCPAWGLQASASPSDAPHPGCSHGLPESLRFYLGAPMSKIVADEVMARDIQNYKLALKRAIDSSQEGELRIIIDGGQQPEKADNGEMGYGVWKVVVEFTLTKPQGGIIFAGGGDLPGWGARHCFTDGQPGVSALWFPTIDAVSLHPSKSPPPPFLSIGC